MSFKKKIFMEFGVASGVLVALATGVIFFSLNMRTFAERLYEGKNDLKIRSASVSRLADLKRVEQQIGAPYLNVLYNFIPKKDELIDFSREMQSVASSEGLEFGFSFMGENPASEDALGSVRFAVNISGPSEENIRGFMQKMQNFRFFIKLEELSIAETENGARGSMRGQVFFRN